MLRVKLLLDLLEGKVEDGEHTSWLEPEVVLRPRLTSS